MTQNNKLFEVMREVCDAAHNFASRWEHKGKCRICDESMETLVDRLDKLAEALGVSDDEE